jgi:O-antigen biosynthesis protein
MRKILSDKLSPAAKLWLKRLLAGSRDAIRSAANSGPTFAKRSINFAARHVLRRGPVWEIPSVPLLPPIAPWTSEDVRSLINDISQRLSRNGDRESINASIIIPVFNKADYTFLCLRSLFREVDLHIGEVIVVDNASTDRTKELLSHFEDFVRVIYNDENRGFVDACNQAASIARGKYLVFLNNDTEVLSGWLTNLLNTVEGDPSVGAVASMFLYPDGTIQEAGGIIWRDGDAFHYGWGKSSDDRQYNFAREVDYCSGASLLVRKDLFERLGRFDRRFAPAYYEDADLCMGVRSLGYKVVYQPESRVIHYEGATAGRDTSKGIKQFQVINRGKFFEKWRVVLERDHYEHLSSNIELAANRNSGPEVIVFDDRIPTPDRDAGSARMAFILKTLAKRCRIVFVYQSKPIDVSYERCLWKAGIRTAKLIDYARLLKAGRFAAAIISRPDVASAVLRGVRRRSPRTKIIFDMVDAYFIRLGLEYQVTGDERIREQARHYKSLELELAKLSDQVWCNSNADRQIVGKAIPDKNLVVIPTIHSLQPRVNGFRGRSGLLFVGHMHHRPNSDGIQYFVNEVFPIVREELRGISLDIVGTTTAEISAYDCADVHVRGYVPNVVPFFQNSRVFIAPLRFGAGTKGKIGDALAYGLPVVTTSVGAEGTGLTNGRNVMIADDPQTFADAIKRLYCSEELWGQVADRGYEYVKQNFSPPIIEEIIFNALRQLNVLGAPDATP